MSIKFTISANVTTTLADLKSVRQQLAALPRQAYNHFVAETPIDTGNARRSTRLVGGTTIEAKYPYATRLDNGYSKQSPKGMTKPTQEFIRKRIKQITGK